MTAVVQAAGAIPVIDIAPLVAGDPAGERDVARLIGSACRGIGFFDLSTPHKVVSPPGRDRYSVAFFLDPDPDAVVACLPGCTAPGRSAKYPPVTAADFLRARLEPTYAIRTT